MMFCAKDYFRTNPKYPTMMERYNLFWGVLPANRQSWTKFDYIRIYSYCHIFDVLVLVVLITGTLEYA
ncbi:hypothetical protein GIB67_024089, partial [Kingdonia uniflora]